uniref:P450-2 n=1 Tax=Phialomyces arenicola TaxID=168477 RepID=A0A6H0XBG3_9EURO|nr:P450-2 [Phialomyces arenicola]
MFTLKKSAIAMYSQLDLTSLLYGVIVSVSFVLFLFLINRLTTWEYSIPKEVPWIDRRNEPLSYLRAKARSFTGGKDNVTKAYFEFNKLGRAAACAIAFGRPQVILPPKWIRWIIDQPDSVLSIDPIHDEFHAFVRDGLVGDHSVQEVLRKELTHKLDRMTSDINDEICAALDDVWGLSTEWRTLPVKESTRTIIARISNRIFVGKALCRNKDYIRNAVGLGKVVMPETVFQDILPKLLKGPVSTLIKAINKIYLSGFNRRVGPLVRQRYIDVKNAEDGIGDKDQLPDELLTWMAQRAVRRGESTATVDQTLTSRVAMANLASIETTTAALDKSLSDLITFGEAGGYLAAVQEEALTVLTGCNYLPEKKDIQKLVHAENALKESLRLAVAFPGLIRQVTSRNGVTLEDGLHLPFGTRLSVAACGIHRDDAVWPDANTYNPARYEMGADAATSGSTQGIVSAMSRGTESFLAFGLGKRACPGRFFVTEELKLLFAHMFAKYEIKVAKSAQKADPFAWLTVGGPQEQLMVRRKPDVGL